MPIKPTPHEEQVMSRSVERRLSATGAKMPPPPDGEVMTAAPREPWRPMADAPRNGQYVYFKNDPDMREWYWYKTRTFRRGRWQDVGWWRLRFGDKQPADFEPDGWRLISEGRA